MEQVGNDFAEESVNFLKEEDNAVVSESEVRKIHMIIYHKSKEQLNYAYRNTGKMTPKVRRWIDKVVRTWKVCKRNRKSNSRPSVESKFSI